jgi:hypothetical protein
MWAGCFVREMGAVRWARDNYISPKRGLYSADGDSLDFTVLGRGHFDTVYTYGLEGIHHLSFNSFFWVGFEEQQLLLRESLPREFCGIFSSFACPCSH